MTTRQEWLGLRPTVTLWADPGTGLTIVRHPGPPAADVPTGPVGDRYELRTATPVRTPDRLVLTAAEFAALRRWFQTPAAGTGHPTPGAADPQP